MDMRQTLCTDVELGNIEFMLAKHGQCGDLEKCGEKGGRILGWEELADVDIHWGRKMGSGKRDPDLAVRLDPSPVPGEPWFIWICATN